MLFSIIYAATSATDTEIKNMGRFVAIFKMWNAGIMFSKFVVVVLISWLFGKAFLTLSILCILSSTMNGDFQLSLFYGVVLEIFTGFEGVIPQLVGVLLFILEILKTIR